MEQLFIFDVDKPYLSMKELLIGGLCVLLISQILTMSICKLFGFDVNKDVDNQQDKISKKWKDSGIKLPVIIMSELLGSVIYTPLAEEFIYKFLLMKKILVETLNTDIYSSCFIQALFFSLTHYVNIITIKQDYNYTILQMISTFVSGIVGGISYIYFNSLVPSIIAHIINNGFVLVDEVLNYVK